MDIMGLLGIFITLGQTNRAQLYSLYTNDCTSKDTSEVEQLVIWCSHNNVELNTLKTVEMTVDLSRQPSTLIPLTISNSPVPSMDFKFLGTIISPRPELETNINPILKKAEQRMYFLRQLRKLDLPQELLIQFYTAVLCTSRTGTDKRTIKTAAKINWVPLPSLKDLYFLKPGNRQGTSSQISLTLDTTYSNTTHLASTTGHCTPRQPDTGTASFLRPSSPYMYANTAALPQYYCLILFVNNV
ncbi:hypothetical protein NFI96_010051 [Prochilodus magdalenae]|nr:hypothetical protein NFI96_010051 [Prochilodus magdalenae]